MQSALELENEGSSGEEAKKKENNLRSLKDLPKGSIKKVLIKKDFFFEITQIQENYEVNLKAISDLKEIELGLLEEKFKRIYEIVSSKEKVEQLALQSFILKILEQEPKVLQHIALIANSYDIRLHNNILEQILKV